MKYTEIKGDLFALPHDFMLVHCISSDFTMGAGIARTFRDKYKVKAALRKKYVAYAWFDKGRCLVTEPTDVCPYVVANLVTKYRHFDKPTYKTMKDALHGLKEYLGQHPEIKKVGMPLIGCGLDRLKWDSVSAIIKQQFEGVDIEIVVCIKE